MGPEQKTRIAAIWLQDLETADADDGVIFGRRLEADTEGGINDLLDKAREDNGVINDAEVYRLAQMHDFGKETHKSTAFRIAHGTHVMDLACGADPDDTADQTFIRDHPIFAVQLPDPVTADTSGMSIGSYVLQGLRQIMLWADQMNNMPLVVNFSYGFTAGPKDGSHYLEVEIDRLIRHRQSYQPETHVVLSAGNSYRSRMAAEIMLEAHQEQSLDWVLLPDDATPSFVEIWFPVASDGPTCPLTIEVAPPVGMAGPDTMPNAGECHILAEAVTTPDQTQAHKAIAGIYYDVLPKAGCGHSGRIFLAVNATKSWEPNAPVSPSGPWRLTLTNTSNEPLHLRFYVQRDDTLAGFRRKGRQSFFDHETAYERDCMTGDYTAFKVGEDGCPLTHDGTLSSLASGERTCVAGAAIDAEPPAPGSWPEARCVPYASGERNVQPAVYTSSGAGLNPNRPDFSAFADDGRALPGILASGSASGSVVAMNGTSVAAPQLTRRIAELGGAKPETTGTPDPRLGYETLRPKAPAIGRRRKYPLVLDHE